MFGRIDGPDIYYLIALALNFQGQALNLLYLREKKIGTKWKTNIWDECKAYNVAISFDPGHDFDISRLYI